MDNNELLKQISFMMEQQANQLDAKMEQQTKDIAGMFEQQTEFVMGEINALKITVENDITKRIDVLFDGYQLNHEKQFELEKRVSNIEHKIGIAV